LQIEELFESLKDGEWHNIEEISNKTKTATNKLIELSKFLHLNGIFLYQPDTKKIKIAPEWLNIIPINKPLH
jgi:hypothetical protein